VLFVDQLINKALVKKAMTPVKDKVLKNEKHKELPQMSEPY